MIKIKQEIEQIFLQNQYGFKTVGLGEKNSKGEYTGEKCISFGVEQKVPLDQIPLEKLIPKTITIDGTTFKTDVCVVVGKIIAYPTYCFPTGDSSVPPNTVHPVSANRARVRPLSGGVSCANLPSTGFFNAGTLGGIVVDILDGKQVGISNNHVIGTPGGSTSYAQVPVFIVSDVSGSLVPYASTYRTLSAYQNSSWDAGVVNNVADVIGIKKRCFPLYSQPTLNKVDGGIINLDDSIVGVSSWYPLSAPFLIPPTFASMGEIDSLTTSDPVFKSSRTTGPVGSDTCALRVTNTSVSLNVDYGDAGVLSFTDCLEITSPITNTVVGSGGDSGSLVYATINSTNPATSAWRCVGLFFAGNGSGSNGYACRIDNVSTLLAVSAWLGGTVNATPNPATYVNFNYSTHSSVVSVISSGKTYWQVGRV